MKSLTTKVFVLTGFLVAFAAGLVTGIQGQPATAVVQRNDGPNGGGGPRRGPGPATRNGPRGMPQSILVRELNLSADQQVQLNQIWAKVASLGAREMDQHRRDLREDRDHKIEDLLNTPDTKEKYHKILTDFSEQTAAMEQTWQSSYRDAVTETKKILTTEQQERYEEILKRNNWDRPGDRGGSRGGRGGGPQGGRGGPMGGRGGPRTDGGGPRTDGGGPQDRNGPQ